MNIPPKYTFTTGIVLYLQNIEAIKALASHFLSSSQISQLNKRILLEKADFLYSFAIPDICLAGDKKIFLMNFFRTYNYLENKFSFPRKTVMNDVFFLHRSLMEGMVERKYLGKFRQAHEINFVGRDLMVYLPNPGELENLLKQLLSYLNSREEVFPLVKASIVFYLFLKISPFDRGNLLTALFLFWQALETNGYLFSRLVFFENLLKKKTIEMFMGEDEKEENVTGYLEYMLWTYSQAAEKAWQYINSRGNMPDEGLLPRQKEIIGIIRQKRQVSLENLHTVFSDVTTRTLRYHLKKLADLGLIIKCGKTRGSIYSLKREPNILLSTPQKSS